MGNWGYSISKDNQIDFDKGNQEIYKKVSEKEPSILSCISCGSCSSTCSAGVFTESVNIRKINTLISRGQVLELLSAMEKCMLCGKCSLVCPRGVNTRNFVYSLKNILMSVGPV